VGDYGPVSVPVVGACMGRTGDFEGRARFFRGGSRGGGELANAKRCLI
jgi:hypothetical protein